jgi:hypothetical protein
VPLETGKLAAVFGVAEQVTFAEHAESAERSERNEGTGNPEMLENSESAAQTEDVDNLESSERVSQGARGRGIFTELGEPLERLAEGKLDGG